jgi:hypothetical protein
MMASRKASLASLTWPKLACRAAKFKAEYLKIQKDKIISHFNDLM